MSLRCSHALHFDGFLASREDRIPLITVPVSRDASSSFEIALVAASTRAFALAQSPTVTANETNRGR